MKKTILYIIVLGSVLFFTIYFIKRSNFFNYLLEKRETNLIEANLSEPVLAVFSFQPGATNQKLGTFPHFTLKLNDNDDRDIRSEVLAQITDSIPLMITVETWGGKIVSSYFNNPLDDVVKGKFDNVIKQLCTQTIGTRPNVYLRFDPEMEVPVNRYPWQYSGGSVYIEAFRHFVSVCKTFSPQVMQVWGPAGYPGTMECYPGDDVVDAVSVTLKSNSEMSLNVYPKNYSVEYDLFRRLHRVRFINKPIFIIGSANNANDSIDSQLVYNLTQLVTRERNIVYSEENFKRPDQKVKDEWQKNFEIGLYDPQSMLNKEESVTVEHLFADFSNLNDETFQTDFNQVVERGHNVIVTFEPFRNPKGETDLNVLQNVTKGMYDNEINRLYEIIQSTDRRVYLRYAHEMEIPITRYPWQSQNPITYIKSYRYFMTFKDQLPLNIKRVWGPAGDRGSLEWWPGNDVVDFISIAIYGLPDKNITDPEKQESFSTIFYRKYWRLRFVDKPIFITEFGVKGPEEYQTKWLEAAAKTLNENPQVIGINYFNMSDTPGAWGKIKAPDWSITPSSLHRFLEVLERDNQ